MGDTKKRGRTDRSVGRRKFFRLERSLPLSLTLVELEGRTSMAEPMEGRTTNISRFGLCVESDKVTASGRNIFLDAMGEEQGLELILFLPGKDEPIKGIAHVEWFDMVRTEELHTFRSGLRLIEMSDSDRVQWDRFVDECGGKSWWDRLKDFIGGFSF